MKWIEKSTSCRAWRRFGVFPFPLAVLALSVSSPQLHAQEPDAKVAQALVRLESSEQATRKKFQASSAAFEILRNPPPNPVAIVEKQTANEIVALFLKSPRRLSFNEWFRDGSNSFIREETLTGSEEANPPQGGRTQSAGVRKGKVTQSFHAAANEPGVLIIAADEPISAPLASDRWNGNISGSYSQNLRAGAPKFMGTEKINDLETWKIETSYEAGGATEKHTAWLAPERGFREVRKNIDVTFNGPIWKTRHIRYETLEFEKFRETWIPKKGAALEWLSGADNTVHWRSLTWFDLLEATSMESEMRSVFDFKPFVGTRISDSINNTTYTYGGKVVDDYLEVLSGAGRPPESIYKFVERAVTEATPE